MGEVREPEKRELRGEILMNGEGKWAKRGLKECTNGLVRTEHMGRKERERERDVINWKRMTYEDRG